MTFKPKLLLSTVLGKNWGRGTFLILELNMEQSESCSWPNLFKQEDCIVIPHSQVTAESDFHEQQCRGCFNTMGFYITTLISFGESSIILRGHEGKTIFREPWMTNAVTQKQFLKWSSLVTEGWFWNKKEILFCCLFQDISFLVITHNTHSRQRLGRDVGRH